MSAMETTNKPGDSTQKSSLDPMRRHHLRFGFWTLLIFLILGMTLESMHTFKVNDYLAKANEVRRLTWTLAHAHGALLAILNVVFGLCIPTLRPGFGPKGLTIASRCFIAATWMMPAGFFLGGLFAIDGDPGIAIALVPAAALLLFIAVFSTARAASRA